jgi:predicted O-methyltransferase YrrM
VREPTSAEDVAAWIAGWRRERDPFEHVRLASEEHRLAHGQGCSVYPTASGPLIGVLAAATGARRILEIGTGLGYSSLWLAVGGASVETIERDPEHAELARANVAEARVTVLHGAASDVLPGLEGPYELVYSDADPREMPEALDQVVRLLRPGGVLISSNLFLGQYVPDLPDLDRMAEYRGLLIDDDRLLTAFAPGGLAVSLVRP